jgi:hypothetical protein
MWSFEVGRVGVEGEMLEVGMDQPVDQSGELDEGVI